MAATPPVGRQRAAARDRPPPIQSRVGSALAWSAFRRETAMEPVLIILVPGLLGGVVLALMIARYGFGPRSTTHPGRLTPPSPSMINMATIRVEGIGGLGMVAAVVIVAIT